MTDFPPGRDTLAFTVLLVDDAEDCLLTLGLALEAAPGFSIRFARTAEAGLAVLDQEAVSAVVTDLQLPLMTGLELITRIRRQERFGAMPILAISAATDPRAAEMALDSGADAFFAKPFSPSAVRKKLEELIHGGDPWGKKQSGAGSPESE
ncbi:MAG TPA: response regulator [Bryobacteraceae bacterium]|nr:response regulator [Bryobacteraceae bacterium]